MISDEGQMRAANQMHDVVTDILNDEPDEILGDERR